MRRLFRPRRRPNLRLALPITLLLVTTVLAAAREATAQDESEPTGWTNEAEVSFVATEGNSETSSLGFGAKFERKWAEKRFEASFGGVRAESADTSRTAIFDDGVVTIDEESSSELTAENYHAKARFDRDFGEVWFWHVGGSWERDPFAGIDHRFQGVSGVGRSLFDREDHTWRLDAGITWTGERLTVGGSEEFLGLRVSSDGSKQITETTKLAHSVQVDENLDDTEDVRIDAKVSLQVAMSKRLALKTALQAKYDNQPALEELDVVDPSGAPVTGVSVLRPLDETDLKATVSLVVNF